MGISKFEFRGKKILIISQQPWSIMRISKHHYSLMLSENGNDVYFLGPPAETGRPGIFLSKTDDAPGITLVNYKSLFSQNLRFRFRRLFDWLIRRDVKKIVRIIGKPDVIWCFETNLYSDLRWFKADLNIFHVVDPVAYDYQKNVGKTADIIIGVSHRILNDFKKIQTPQIYINHGLCKPFASNATEKLKKIDSWKSGENFRVGYIGNMARGPVNHNVFYKIIKAHPEIEFHFWGNFTISSHNNKKEADFIEFLKSANNVFLHGIANPDELVNLISGMTMFLLIYKYILGESDLSNSHKLLEYLSTGKHILSSSVDAYKEFPDIIFMPSDIQDNDDELIKLFEKSVNNIELLNSPELQAKRIQLSLSNTYDQQLNRIQNFINTLC